MPPPAVTRRLEELEGERMFWFERARHPAFFDHCQKIFARHRFTPNTVKLSVADLAGVRRQRIAR